MAALFWFRGIHNIRPHVPLIQFPKRLPFESLFPAKPAGSSDLALQKADGDSVNSKARTSNLNILEVSELPTKYQRAIILPEEIAYIERGGPD